VKTKKIILTLKKDLNSIVSFESWVKKSTGDYGEGDRDRVPLGHLQKYLNYINNKLDEIIGSNKSDWKKAIDSLQERVSNVKSK